MRTAIILLFVLGFRSLLFAQSELIELKAESTNFEPKKFYIQEVVDGRSYKENIGFVQKGAFNRKVNADLKDGIEAAIFNYLKTSISQDTTTTPVVMRVVYLNISEHTSFTETGRAEIKVEFYKNEDGFLSNVYNAEAFIEKPGMDVTRGHEKRIREVILTCLKSFDSSDWQNVSHGNRIELSGVENAVSIDSIHKEGPVFSDVKQEMPRWNSLLTFNKTFGVNAEGWALSYYAYTDNETNKWIVPWVVSIESYTLDPTYFGQWGYREARFSYYMPGISAFKKLNEKGTLMANYTLMIPVGSERLTDFYGNESTRFVVGLAPSQGLYFVPKSNFGITFGIGIYEKLLTSKVYKSDIGIKAELGIKF